MNVYRYICRKIHTNRLLISLTIKQRELSNSSLFGLTIALDPSSQTKCDPIFVLYNLIGHQDDQEKCIGE